MISSLNIAATDGVSAAAESHAKANINYDAFLNLLIASMKNQDPTQPNDPSETLSQLASFSNVEQSLKTNEKLDQLLSVMTAGQAASLIGREITSLDGLKSGLVQSVEIHDGNSAVLLQSGERIELNIPVRIG
ncbi:MAG: flagellar hook assembly protein FlgD [Alphaproteobacteria bacterium]|nr:flagellar hook assembly protein FlgD [Alphaproteobacteria bacterium]